MAGILITLISGLGQALDLLCLLLDLNFWLVSSVLAAVSGILHLLLSLPGAVACLFTLCYNLLGLLVLGAAQLCHCTLQFVLNLLCSLLRVGFSLAESLKLVGHLLSYLSLRGREMLQRGFANVFSSGHFFLKQVWDALGIMISLSAYFVNTLINLFLIGTQNLLSLVTVLWDPLIRVLDVFASVLTSLSNSVLGNVILLWTPCQFIIEVLISLTKLLADVFLLNLYGLAITFVVIFVTTIYANPEIILRITNQVTLYLSVVPNFHWVRRNIAHICGLLVATMQLMVNSEMWRRMYSQQLQGLNPGYISNWPLDQRRQRQTDHNENLEDQTIMDQQLTIQLEQQTDPSPAQGDGNLVREQHLTMAETSVCGPEAGNGSLHSVAKPSGSKDNDSNVPVEDNLWMLLKEQEERKKCVICQDQAKSVLLLPCRHLCLCQGCTAILLEQPIYQRNCPLCRQMILQTLDVYF
ncbi:E3 ubiquitin-protein ligase RNF26 [Stegostoma tigrinum]|uniref:E3 ubiquitin-protein ligase RNF26 n=1 Tax=Stegostoma tigrinum TaxID=3053191 RepID=UPI00202B5288|nr:E3 ubiquitin-protein ligase RNF26 [Stegostoma tigrinum]